MKHKLEIIQHVNSVNINEYHDDALICIAELPYKNDWSNVKEQIKKAKRIVKCVNGWDKLEIQKELYQDQMEILKSVNERITKKNKNLREALKGFTEAGYPIADDKFQVLLNQAKKLL